MNKNKAINARRQRREFHTRRKVRGTGERPRLTVFRSHKHIYCELIDDLARRTLVSASTPEPRREEPAFDHAWLAKALGEAMKKPVDAQRLDKVVTELGWNDDGRLDVSVRGGGYLCDIAQKGACMAGVR